jgi:hypothetical protein
MVGPKIVFQNNKMLYNGSRQTKKQKIQLIVELLKFALSINDPEILNSTIESVIETLEDLNK